MGQTGSRVANKIANSFSFSESASDDYIVEVANTAAVASFKGTPFVFTRRGSMYFDEDGDLAHEFYEEVAPKRKGGKRKMKKIVKNLKPQGEVKYQVPRLHVDFPIILFSN
eukprot:TRINITY_DN16094_c0_g1_i1.p1 TRINITY_DN16094_c0_g1~~TRINITY_DN16094_c0_g1_i1.p1  ORF type:complete len:111 (-),score=27.74 TRINITY_DN16094_c0_g1_i1:93-425(-)